MAAVSASSACLLFALVTAGKLRARRRSVGSRSSLKHKKVP
eukprot:CAMPEP_0168488008 /NCGR_PEP_ID=MMETSP0228-20121227/67930_1 /TAXON_ID=133427 /ORGANISM="Protoceratium reticulatum, Strain CCCM 535 (=CCMP 1889)" /LENGTH=40 /DNA_ID= /DNA_START= /DNA_END= /DNA_ORIENTATION=